MTPGSCRLPECTFNLTGQCVSNYAIEECPNRVGSQTAGSESISAILPADGDTADTLTLPDVGSAVLEAPASAPRLPRSGTLNVSRAGQLMSSRQTTLVGIVGLPASGKTACLVSAYLLLAHGQFPGFTFADSCTLMAFEEIARGSRKWNLGRIPADLTLHTEMVDDREAGFLHLRLVRQEDEAKFDLLLPDLPGEWSRALIDQNHADRFDFLMAATVIWIMVDGRQFVEKQSRRYATYRAQCLVERLAKILPTPRPRIMLVSSWRDSGDFPREAFEEIRVEGERFGMDVSLTSVASFSLNDAIEPGKGLAELFEQTLRHDRSAPEFWADTDTSDSARSLLRYRSAA